MINLSEKYFKPFHDFNVENTTIKLHLDTGNIWRVIAFTRSFQTLPTWKFKKVKPRSNLAEILMSRIPLPVQIQLDAGKFWGITIFTRSCKILPFEHDLVQKVKKVGQRSTSNVVIPAELWCSQGSMTVN